MGKTLERTADGTAGALARTAARVHTLTCEGCRARLAELRTENESR